MNQLKAKFLISLILFFVASCTFRFKIKERYFSKDELVQYVKQNNYPFESIMRFKNQSGYKNRATYSINRLNFLNLYAKNNELVKATDGENCEFKLVNFIRDSLEKATPISNSNLNTLEDQCDLIQIAENSEINSRGKYKILVGWSINLNSIKIAKKRLYLLTKLLEAYKENFIIIGFNVDYSET